MIKINFQKNESFSDSVELSNKSAPTKEPLQKASLHSKGIKKEKKIFNISKEVKPKT
jgi:hypothetical protein